MTPNTIATALCLAAALLAGGCGTVKKERKENALTAALSAYGEAVRWGYHETAYGYLHPDLRAERPMPDLTNIRVTGYDVVQPPLQPDEESANQVVRIEYVHEDEQRLRALSDRQIWRYDPDTKAWWLHSGLPGFE